jgi:hypothetical protein
MLVSIGQNVALKIGVPGAGSEVADQGSNHFENMGVSMRKFVMLTVEVYGFAFRVQLEDALPLPTIVNVRKPMATRLTAYRLKRRTHNCNMELCRLN